MSALARLHRFCTSEGVLISDEQITLDEYLALDAQEEAEPAAAAKSIAKDSKAESTTDAKPEEEIQLKAKTNESKELAPIAKKQTVPRLNLYYRSTSSAEYLAKAAAAPKAEVAPLDMTMRDNPSAADLPTLAPPTAPQSLIDKDYSFAAASTGNNTSVTAGTLSEAQWMTVLRNCAVFYGWKIDTVSQRVVRAPRAAFQLRTTSGSEQSLAAHGSVQTKPTSTDYVDTLEESEAAGEASYDDDAATGGADPDREAQPEIDAEALARRGFDTMPKGIPNFRTNDDSRIEVTACATSLAVSMAKSDFSSQSTEGSISGGYAGVTAGVSAGYASDNSNALKNTSSLSTQTLVARYMFPRCDLFLRPEDLEPTPEFASLLDKVRTTKSIDALRQIQDQYGQ